MIYRPVAWRDPAVYVSVWLALVTLVMFVSELAFLLATHCTTMALAGTSSAFGTLFRRASSLTPWPLPFDFRFHISSPSAALRL